MQNNVFWSQSKAPLTGTATKRPSVLTGPVTKSPRLNFSSAKSSVSFGIGATPARHPNVTSSSQLVAPLDNTKITDYFRARDPLARPDAGYASNTTTPVSGPAPRTGLTANNDGSDGLRKPVSELPEKFRPVFPYVSFNHVQSLVFNSILDSSKPIIVSAPTGSGKTGVFELAIIKVIMDCERKGNYNAVKIVYLAPTKALCTERRRDWENKFKPYNIQCLELTGDTGPNTSFKNLARTSILLATPEKWDSITRSWIGQKSFVQTIRLLLVDEIHLVNDGERGATLEAVISRMKTIRSMIWPTEQENLRFVGVSATVSNVQDIATWFSTPSLPAEVYQVDPRERPVKLRTIVLGYTSTNDNEFAFDSLLNSKLSGIIKDHSKEKPTLVFCATRKSAEKAAKTLASQGGFNVSFSNEKRKEYLKLSSQIKNSDLQEATRFGIAFHHAGLSAGDRRLVESGFLDGYIMMLCCTSTLALGVNLPAHLVIIKNTVYFDSGQFRPYSESSLVQMIGRAGRPQFDTEATAVIMTKASCRDEIEKMLTGKLIVDSQLHKFLTEHLNSEIVLGTVNNDNIARKWIESTFLHVRLMRNPENYGLKTDKSKATIENTIINWCKGSIDLLLKNGIAKRGNQGQLEPTDAGRAMARHYICLKTMVNLINLKGSESLWELIQLICSCNEVSGDIQLRLEDKPTLNSLLNPHDEEQALRFPMGDRVQSKDKKAAALIQATFGNIGISENNLFQDSLRVLKNAHRIVNCLKDISLVDKDITYHLLLNVLVLCQCFAAKLWENSVYISKQLEKIGPILSHNLARNGLTTFEALRKANPRNIEVFCNRLPPFGSNVQQTCFGLPIYEMTIQFRKILSLPEKIQLLVEVSMSNGLDLRNKKSISGNHSCILMVGCPKTNKLLLRHQIIDAVILNRPDLTMCYGTELDRIDLPNNFDIIRGHIISEMFVGLDAIIETKYIEPEEDPY